VPGPAEGSLRDLAVGVVLYGGGRLGGLALCGVGGLGGGAGVVEGARAFAQVGVGIAARTGSRWVGVGG